MALLSKSLVETLCESGPKSLFWVARPQLFTRWIALSTGWITIQRISVREANCAIQWIVIYPVDNVIHLLYNWGQMCTRILSARHDRPVKSHCLICQSGWRDIRDTSSYSLGSKTRIFGTVRTPLDEAIFSAEIHENGIWFRTIADAYSLFPTWILRCPIVDFTLISDCTSLKGNLPQTVKLEWLDKEVDPG